MKYLFSDKAAIVASLVAVMDHRRHDRALSISGFKTRCVRRGEIHEFLLCMPPPENDASPINEISYLGFAEIQTPGVIAVGDRVVLGEAQVGTIYGFDDTHMPNHMNIVLEGTSLKNGAERGLRVTQSLYINPPHEEKSP